MVVSRRRRGLLAASCACLVIAALCHRGLAWLGAGKASNPEHTASPGRRSVLQESAAAATAAMWLMPEEAEAFRVDRIFNAKQQLVPKIRKYYQKLEGLRDDLLLQVELAAGSRVEFRARPAEWFSGVDNKFDGTFQVVGQLDGKYGCTPYKLEAGSIALVARGICTFEQKAQMAKAAGAKAIIVYDEKMSKAPLEQQNRTGRVASKGIQSYQAGDALSGASSAAVEKGMTLMMGDQGKPDLDGCMITRANGTALVDSINNGFQPKVLDVKRSRFEDGIDRFIKKDLPKLSTAMDGYSLIQRVSKTDPNEPIVNQLKADQKEFEKAVRSKDYGEIRKTWKKWNSDLDQTVGVWDLAEVF
ncbi:erkA [Symbiodinium sp. CCMP2592]|nr:erkA [Symbiodinium sp. CCMP2592]